MNYTIEDISDEQEEYSVYDGSSFFRVRMGDNGFKVFDNQDNDLSRYDMTDVTDAVEQWKAQNA